jgi:hypothetical protein
MLTTAVDKGGKVGEGMEEFSRAELHTGTMLKT